MSFFDLFRNILGLPQKPNTTITPDAKDPDQFLNSLFKKDESNKLEEIPTDSDLDVFQNIITIHKFFEEKMQGMMEQLLEQQQMFDQLQISDVDPLNIPEGIWSDIPPDQQTTKLPTRSRNPRGDVLKPGYETIDEAGGVKIDRDLDEYVSKYGMRSLLQGNNEAKLDAEIPNKIISKSRSRSRKLVTRPDGSVESEEVMRDSNGNELRKIIRTIGDQSHTKEIKTGPDGTTTTTETFENCDEKDFTKKWDSITVQKPGDNFPKLLPETFSLRDLF